MATPTVSADLGHYISVDEQNVQKVISTHPLKQNTYAQLPLEHGDVSDEVNMPQRKNSRYNRGSFDIVRRSLEFIRLKSPDQSGIRSSIELNTKYRGSIEESSHAVKGTASLAEHLLIRSLEKDFAKLLVLHIKPPCESIFRSDLNRLELLAECRLAGIVSGESDCIATSALQLRDLRLLQVLLEANDSFPRFERELRSFMQNGTVEDSESACQAAP